MADTISAPKIKKQSKDNFTKPEFRKYQEEILDAVDQYFDEGYKYIVLQAPTGIGKSEIAHAVAKNAKDAYILTSQKILQEQYLRDYGDSSLSLFSMKGKNNYKCLLDGAGVDKAPCQMMNKFPRSDDACTLNEHITNKDNFKQFKDKYKSYYEHDVTPMDFCACPYMTAKRRALRSKIMLTNYDFFVLGTRAGLIDERELIVMDEAHRVDEAVLNHVDFSITEGKLKGIGIKIPFEEDIDMWHDVLKRRGIDAVKSKIEQMQQRLKKSQSYKDLEIVQHWESQLSKMKMFVGTHEKTEWVLEVKSGKYGKTATFKPLRSGLFFQEVASQAKKILMMSATILDKYSFCKSLGISVKDIKFISVPSIFPKKNRQVELMNVSTFNYRNKQESYPKMANAIQELLTKHKDRGIIHTTTYEMANYIRDNVKDKRLIFHTSFDRSEKLQQFMSDESDLVMVSPSMTEGVDLAYDLARWQVIVKVPYPSLQEKRIKKRMEKDPQWYQWRALVTLIQAAGRSIRHCDDWAHTYILDSGAKTFLERNGSMVPNWFKKSIL